ncbi:LPS export ABC transporter permease LptG [Advenella sp. RU8]|uniref:LPS export ABC transporter permease LptG n=1 Tax=Advenella sp. RU8 TaxID=3399575 RepID=UPI003AB06C1B
MHTARRYLASEIYRATTAVLLVLLGLFTFFSLIDELDKINDNFSLLSLLYLEALQIPTRLYDLLPIGLLIGATMALASLAQRNELVILRVSGVSSAKLLLMLWIICIPIMGGALVLSEFLAPAAEVKTSELSLKLLGKAKGGRMSSGYWFREPDPQGNARVINIGAMQDNGNVQDIRIITYDKTSGQFLHFSQAPKGFFKDNLLTLNDVSQTQSTVKAEEALANPNDPVKAVAKIVFIPSLTLETTLTPDRLLAGELQPEKMSVVSLLDYITYLDENNLQTSRQFVALWRKGSYPFTLLVMMTIAAPISFIQTRSGGVGAKVFMGILLGVGFFMFNQLSLNLGMLNNLPAWTTALAPNILGLAIALMALYFMEAKRTTKNHTSGTGKKKTK